ncbi:Uncharacterised protein [Vibrio cholerae]|nr:Uncharacterised protein [Vibrio cholerae]
MVLRCSLTVCSKRLKVWPRLVSWYLPVNKLVPKLSYL